MVLLKRKAIHFTPLPSLSTVLQPLVPNPADSGASTSSPAPIPSPANDHHPTPDPGPTPIPPDATHDDGQLDKLLSVFRGEFAGASGNVGPGKGKKAGTRVLNQPPQPPPNGVKQQPNGSAVAAAANATLDSAATAQENGEQPVAWRIWDRECFYIPETGEIFTDYESFLNRVTFYQQPLFQCEVSSKSSLSFFAAQQSEHREARQLHTRFPSQLKKAVLTAVQFQVEGKLDTLADKIYERYANRFFDDERVFVDVEGDKYLARIVKTFPPRSLTASTSSQTLSPHSAQPAMYHPHASDLNLPNEEVLEMDDPMKYFYNVRLIEEGAAEGIATDYSGANGQHSNGMEDTEKWQGSTMEVQADKISRDRINFSRVMLKRFIRDCVVRESAIYSPWMVKPSVAARYGLPTEMSDEVRESIQRYKERQMDKRKREREGRLGITHGSEADTTTGVMEDDKPKTKKQRKEEERRLRDEEREREKEDREAAKKKAMKYPAEDLLVEYSQEKDAPAGRIEVRPPLNRNLPFGDQFERLLMSWSFLNVMGKPLSLSPFTLDDYEQALYHNDPWTSPTPLMTEIHSTLLNALIVDLANGNEAVKPLSLTGRADDNDTDYWEGKKGATAETLRPEASKLAESWKSSKLQARDGRKGWEAVLVGSLWERATLETLPNYLDHILHLTFEDKPAPTRPTWTTAPVQSSGHGLVLSKPDKRYSSLHHLHKLEIIAFLIELVAQTAAVRDFMEESTAALTEVRKDQVEAKREWKRIRAEREALDPKKSKNENGEEEAAVDADGDAMMESSVPPIKGERAGSVDVSINGVANGTGTNTERDELDSSPAPDDDESLSDPDADVAGPNVTAASRRKAMKERAAEREAEEANRVAKVAEERAKKAESKVVTAERKRLADENDAIVAKMRSLEYDFRSHMYTLRARPVGLDRFCNKVWWLDGLGSAPLVGESGKVLFGTGRLYVQGVEDVELDITRLPLETTAEEVEARRSKEEGEGRLGPGEWGMYETQEELAAFVSWLNPRGVRELATIKGLNQWMPELCGGMSRRRIVAGLETPLGSDEPVKRNRPVRKVVAAGGGGDEEGTGYMGWRNRRATGKE